MYLLTYEYNGDLFVGVLNHNQSKVIPLQKAEQHYLRTSALPNDILDIIKNQSTTMNKIEEIISLNEQIDDSVAIPLNKVAIKAPIPRPHKNIYCVGKNYLEHAYEFERTSDEKKAIPKHPVIFSKAPTSVIGTEERILSHTDITQQLDYEAELAVVIGKEGVDIAKDAAWEYIFGYTIINDVTARDLQRKHAQWLRGKSLDSFAPMGPYLVSANAVEDPTDLLLKCEVNGELRQKANTKDLLFDIPEIISTLSHGTTLEPGDIIATGTPSGVGIGFDPQRFLKAGDVIEIEISKLGILKNEVI